MTKPLRHQILEYLKENDAVDKKIDVGYYFLDKDDSTQARKDLRHALDYLAGANFILLTGQPINMLAKQQGQYPTKYNTDLKASITKLGELEIKPVQETPAIQISHVGHNINAPVSQSDLSNIGDNSFNKQTITNTTETNNPKRSKTEILYWIVGIVVGLIAIYEFLHKIHFVLKF